MLDPQKTLVDLAWPRLLHELAERAHTDRGAAACLALTFAADAGEARERIAEISEARLLWQLTAPMPFGGLRDVVTLVARADKGGVLDASELYAIAGSVAGVAALRRHLSQNKAEAPRLWAIIEHVLELAHVSGPILDCIDEAGRLLDHASPALGGLRKRLASLHEQLGTRTRQLVEDFASDLQDRFYTQREDRYVLPVKSSAQSRVKGIVHGSSGSGQTVFIEPEEIVDLNNRLKLAESDVFEEEQRILAELTGYVTQDADNILAGLRAADRLDLIDAGARLADALEATPPEIADDGDLKLPQARHPLMALTPRGCVASDLALAHGQTLVVSGPNAGGKTVALKNIGLAALMARAGLHVAAGPGARVPFCSQVLSDIGDDQSIEKNLSSFTAHIQNVKDFLAAVDDRSLVLLDEIAVGTEPEQGAALAQAVLEAIADKGSQVVVTTHYERLKTLAAQDPRFVNASVGFDLTRMSPTFEVTIGVPGSSAALLVARRMGLDTDILARGEALLGDRRAGVEELMVALAEERRRLDEERRSLAGELRTAQSARREADALRNEAERRLKDIRKGAHDEALADLRRARDELARVQKLVRKATERGVDPADVLDEARAEIAEAQEKINRRAPAPAAPSGREARLEDLVAGTRVFVAKLGGRGEIVSPPDKGKVTVAIGALKTTVSLDEIRLDDSPAPAKLAARKSSPTSAVKKRGPRPTTPALNPDGTAAEPELAVARTPDATCDLRGQRVDEGLAELDRFLDASVMAEREIIFVIHGHGTGAMKSAVRQHLGAHTAVDKTRPGTLREGGDGVTVVWLTD